MWRGGVDAAYLLPALSMAGASLASPCFRFHIPLIEPDRPISGIRLSEKVSRCRRREIAQGGLGMFGICMPILHKRKIVEHSWRR
jgi:hypothetical protein